MQTLEIPACLRLSDEFTLLTNEDQIAFVTRLENLREIGINLMSKDQFNELKDFSGFFEDLELDLAIRQGLSTGGGKGVSVWLIHYSWTFLTSPAEMRRSLSPELLILLDSSEPPSDTSPNKIIIWFQQMGKALVELTDAFIAADTLSRALALHITIDFLALKLLGMCYKLRLNPSMQR